MNILYFDNHLIVVDKPAGIPVLPDGWTPDAPYLRQMLENDFDPSTGSGQAVWVVHRLDKVTSGVMVFARDAETHRHLNTQFEQHTVRKTYHAIVEGVPEWETREAHHKLRANVGKKHRTVVDHTTGKESETRFNVLRRGQAYSLVAAAPLTGRTHQVRVHSAAVGYPLLGDILYGASPTDLIGRPALHAAVLTFVHPASGETVTFDAPYPQDFAAALQTLIPSNL